MLGCVIMLKRKTGFSFLFMILAVIISAVVLLGRWVMAEGIATSKPFSLTLGQDGNQAVERKPFLPEKSRTLKEFVFDFNKPGANATWEEFRALVALNSGQRVKASQEDFFWDRRVDVVDCHKVFPNGVTTVWTGGKGSGRFGTKKRPCRKNEQAVTIDGQPIALTSCGNPVVSSLKPEPKVVEEKKTEVFLGPGRPLLHARSRQYIPNCGWIFGAYDMAVFSTGCGGYVTFAVSD